jgi:hypothetical protein
MPRSSPGHGGWYIAKNEKFEALDVIQQFDLGYEKGNALEYLLRAGKKPDISEIEDLRKAIFYLQERIRQIDHNPTISKELGDLGKPSERDWT